MNSDYIRFLEEIGKHDTGFAGGKGANLGEIFRARLPVPPAFVVTTKAYEVFSKSHGLEQKIERILSRIDVDDFANLEKGAAEIRRIVESSALPGEVSRVVELANKDSAESPQAEISQSRSGVRPRWRDLEKPASRGSRS